MRVVCQVVKNAKLYSDGIIVSQIGQGLLVYAGFSENENNDKLAKTIKKICGLRVFADSNGKLNLSLSDIGGQMLFVSNFTLYADCSSGFRPSFMKSAKFDLASRLYDHCLDLISGFGIDVSPGAFGKEMIIESTADGPINIIIDSEDL